jgi:hypothetical protein
MALKRLLVVTVGIIDVDLRVIQHNQKTLQGHVMGVWAMVPWDDILVSGGCDREVRVSELGEDL